MSLHFKTGLKHSPAPPQLRFGAFLSPAVLPSVPAAFGHYDNIPRGGWGMLGNDQVGDCTIAAPMHAVMYWCAATGRVVQFTEADALDDYRDACGYRGTPDTDQGGDMVSVASYWKKTGFRDSRDQRHQISAYMKIDASNLQELDAACYLFGVVNLGVKLPDNAETQFSEEQPWSLIADDTANDYHDVLMVGKDSNYRKVITWGSLQDVQEDWLKANLDEAVAVVSAEYLLASGKTLEGFNMAAMLNDLGALI